jgi:hypothetical protein
MTTGIDPRIALNATYEAGAALASAISIVDQKKGDLSNRLAAATPALEAATAAFSQLSEATTLSSPDIQAKLTRAIECSSAALKASSELISAVGFTGTVGSPVDEWKECRTTIDRCDKILVDLRKTGFGFVTAVVGVAAYVFSTSNEFAPKAALLWMLVILIVTLYLVDLAHQTWLGVAVKRAEELERRLSFSITQNISSGFAASQAVRLGFLLYFVLLVATCAIFWSSVWKEAPQSGHHVTIGTAFVIGLVAMIAGLRSSSRQVTAAANTNAPALPIAPPQQPVLSLEDRKVDLERRLAEAQAKNQARRGA